MTSDVKYLFIYLLAPGVSSLEICLFSPYANFNVCIFVLLSCMHLYHLHKDFEFLCNRIKDLRITIRYFIILDHTLGFHTLTCIKIS